MSPECKWLPYDTLDQFEIALIRRAVNWYRTSKWLQWAKFPNLNSAVRQSKSSVQHGIPIGNTKTLN